MERVCVYVQGRVLVLDNVEKAERCVLPALNNLLEARYGRSSLSSTVAARATADAASPSSLSIHMPRVARRWW